VDPLDRDTCFCWVAWGLLFIFSFSKTKIKQLIITWFLLKIFHLLLDWNGF
jgi:hypothetical protein